MTNSGLATQYGGRRINNHMVFYRWMAFGIGHVFGHAQGAEGNTLVNFYIIAYNTGFANYNAGAVVYIKMLANTRGRVNINTCFRVRILG